MLTNHELTDEQKKEYIRNPYRCPACGSDYIVGAAFDMGDNQVWQNVVCSDCGKEWTDIYTLTDIEEVQEC